ncbi:uncharacterized protein [Zea mays]|uniref:uncharacterized protein n=1 Tax=Zea mays TaxID=4577 RepID=UPI0004DE970C|nr:uncharacterized protein LOC103654183 [Zea mays]|eukprot:XP_008679233.1 uncharacterized protein LOC103654183 [Zea mays]
MAALQEQQEEDRDEGEGGKDDDEESEDDGMQSSKRKETGGWSKRRKRPTACSQPFPSSSMPRAPSARGEIIGGPLVCSASLAIPTQPPRPALAACGGVTADADAGLAPPPRRLGWPWQPRPRW